MRFMGLLFGKKSRNMVTRLHVMVGTLRFNFKLECSDGRAVWMCRIGRSADGTPLSYCKIEH